FHHVVDRGFARLVGDDVLYFPSREQRSTYSQHHWYLFQRDKRVSGCNSELYPKGLENIN
ncbi:hypothetical protein DNTS_000295, partial [Danionella cerebrum]